MTGKDWYFHARLTRSARATIEARIEGVRARLLFSSRLQPTDIARAKLDVFGNVSRVIYIYIYALKDNDLRVTRCALRKGMQPNLYKRGRNERERREFCFARFRFVD